MSKPNVHSPLAEQESQATVQAPSLIDEVANWLMTQALEETDFESMYEGCCERLLAAGVPLWRGLISFSVLHPLYSSMDITWMRGKFLGNRFLGLVIRFPIKDICNPDTHSVKSSTTCII